MQTARFREAPLEQDAAEMAHIAVGRASDARCTSEPFLLERSRRRCPCSDKAFDFRSLVVDMRAHLPAATDYADRRALRDVRTADLIVLLDECTGWAEDL